MAMISINNYEKKVICHRQLLYSNIHWAPGLSRKACFHIHTHTVCAHTSNAAFPSINIITLAFTLYPSLYKQKLPLWLPKRLTLVFLNTHYWPFHHVMAPFPRLFKNARLSAINGHIYRARLMLFQQPLVWTHYILTTLQLGLWLW